MLQLTLKELQTMALILRKSDNVNSCQLEMLVNEAIEHEKNLILEKYSRQFGPQM